MNPKHNGQLNIGPDIELIGIKNLEEENSIWAKMDFDVISLHLSLFVFFIFLYFVYFLLTLNKKTSLFKHFENLSKLGKV